MRVTCYCKYQGESKACRKSKVERGKAAKEARPLQSSGSLSDNLNCTTKVPASPTMMELADAWCRPEI